MKRKKESQKRKNAGEFFDIDSSQYPLKGAADTHTYVNKMLQQNLINSFEEDEAFSKLENYVGITWQKSKDGIRGVRELPRF